MGVYLILGQRYKIIVNWQWCCDEGGSVSEKLVDAGRGGRIAEKLGESRRREGIVQKKLPMGLDSFLSLLFVWF